MKLRQKSDTHPIRENPLPKIPVIRDYICTMRKPLIALLVIIVALMVVFMMYPKKKKEKGPKQQPVAVSKYSEGFNNSIASYLDAYYNLSEALVKWDSGAVVSLLGNARAEFEAISLDELKKDTAIYETALSNVPNFQSDFEALTAAPNLEQKRRAFHSLSQNTYTFLQTVQYDRNKIYLHECPMAFNDTESALWLSAEGEDNKRRNPYLGLHHPRYHAGMLTCGETRDSLNYGGPK
jgi:hypothetical protein